MGKKDHKQQEKSLLTDYILTAREVAEYLRLTENTVCKLAASGELPGFKIGKSWRFAESEIQRRLTDAKAKSKT